MPEFSTTVKMNTLISTFHFRLHNSTAHLSNVLKLSWIFLPNETFYVENIKSTEIILGANTKSTNLRIQELVIFNQARKIDTQEEKYFHSISYQGTTGEEPSSLVHVITRVTRSLVLCICVVDRSLSFCRFSFSHCVVFYDLWILITLWYLQILIIEEM